MLQVSESIYRLFAGFTGNQYLIVEPDGLTLVDTGLPGSDMLVFARMEDLGRPPQDLKRILITHADPDHAGATQALKNGSGARVYASAIEATALRQGRMTRPIASHTLEGKFFNLMLPLFPMTPAEVDEIVRPGQELPILGGLLVLESPGHTPGHISYYTPRQGILFSGDSVKIRGDNLSAYQGDSTWDKAAARRSFDRQMALQPEFICAGHGFYPVWY